MLRKLPLIAAIIVFLALSSCNNGEYFCKDLYFNSAVIVEYKQSRSRNSDDYVTIKIYERGTYYINFSKTNGKRCSSSATIPQDIVKNIETAPREIVIKHYILPDFLTISISRDGKVESHDFH